MVEFDVGIEEVVVMMCGVFVSVGVIGLEWDKVLVGYSIVECVVVIVYVLDV